MTLKLHVYPPSPRAFKVLAVASYLDLDYELCMVDFMKGTHKTPEFTALNPNQKMPVLEDDSFVLWEANAILQYLAGKRPEKGLLPTDSKQRALVAQWQCWDLAHWEPGAAMVIFERVVKARFGRGPEDPAKVAEGFEKFDKAAPVLETYLAKQRFVVGDQVTIADFSLGAVLTTQPVTKFPLDRYPNITRWYQSLNELPCWQQSLMRMDKAA